MSLSQAKSFQWNGKQLKWSLFWKNDRLSVHQSVNKKWHSTETSLIYTSDRILTAVDQKKTSAVEWFLGNFVLLVYGEIWMYRKDEGLQEF